MRTVRLHDTLSGELKELRPREGRKVGIYACGPTVYGRIHVGNARPFVVFSLLARFLAHEGYEPTLVANITDINDKIYDAARPAGRPSDELAAEMTDAYIADTERLGLGRPDHEPRATLMVDEIVALIGDADRARARVRGRGRRLLPRPLAAGVRRAVAPRPRADGPGRGRRGRRAASRIRSTSRSGRRRSRWRTRPGTRRGAAGGRAGTSSARRWPRRRSARRSTSTAAAAT